MKKLSFLRVARKATDGHDGYVYRHNFGTGFQDLIFESHEAANRWLLNEKS